MVARVKVPCCSVCHTRYNEDERVPLLLQCGHGFCKDCLSKMFSTSSDTTLTCPRCRHVSVVGNSVQGLRKNYAMLALIHSASGGANFDCDYTDDEDEDGEEDGTDEDGARSARGFHASSSINSSCGPVIEVGAHPEMKLVRQIGEESSGGFGGVEMWDATVAGGGGRCKHLVTVKKMTLTEEMDVEWMQGQLESLRRASMWCRNVCTFHGVVKMEGSLCLLMDRCYGSVLSEMQRNEGRLTLEQILRFLSCFSYTFILPNLWLSCDHFCIKSQTLIACFLIGNYWTKPDLVFRDCC